MLRMTLSTLVAVVVLALVPASARSQECGADEPGKAVWTVVDGDEALYEAVFTAREGTLACFNLLNEQYDRRESQTLPEEIPAWLSAEGHLNLVTTWDTEYLPFSFSFLELKNGKPLVRKVQRPVTSAPSEEWKAGEVKEASYKDFYRYDPTYTLVKATDDEIVYVWPDPAQDKSEFFIEKRYRKLTGYRIGLSVTIYNFGAAELVAQPQVMVHSWEVGKEKTGLFSPPPNVLEGLCLVGEGDLERESGSDLIEEAANPAGEARWVAVGDRYFLVALLLRGMPEGRCSLSAQGNGVVSAAAYRSGQTTIGSAGQAMCYPDWYRPGEPGLRCREAAQALELTLDGLFDPAVHNQAYASRGKKLPEDQAAKILPLLKRLSAGEGAVQFGFEFYLGPKDLERLQEAEAGLEDSIDFWIVGFLSKPMLFLLRWFHSLVPNWVFAIVMLTILVKLALLYWTQKSFSQMQRMAKLKPMMDELKEKYGKDKERLNQEMMNLYKREKVNPLGGCLPMLLQMPIWIALYRTIYSSVDLYQAPLGGWIQDLSAPDPYFVLPLLLGASMFFQQKMTPTTMDSSQAKMMLYMMPVMFTVFMLFLPSGLNLYILVNTFLTMLQQWYLRKSIN
jgi:YidC/Oxa1 family membrane protein insertase